LKEESFGRAGGGYVGWAFLPLGAAYLKRGDYDPAIAFFKEAVIRIFDKVSPEDVWEFSRFLPPTLALMKVKSPTLSIIEF